MIAPTTNTSRNTYRRCFASHERFRTPTFVSPRMMIGISNTRPIARMKVVTNEMYSEARSWFSITALPKLMRNLIELGSSTK